ncbi:RNA-directed DNA polymerase, eukaryota, reverse transcriptase zinc-binding domain protein [Tanacetum coccineum]
MVEWIMQCVTTAGFTININGDKVGYFKGGRGLRQGDPISPYLFTLIMEVFSLMLKRKIVQEPRFQYHFGCKDIKLTHVSFADDLLVMCHGDAESVKVIKSALDEFSACSGLIPNNSKSSVFFGSLSDDECSGIRSVLPFAVGNLPVRYLAVLESIHVYWASVFLLPITIIKEINKLLKGFLWNHGETSKGNAKVAWKNICKPKDQGGLGLKNLQVWNKALLAKHVWNIATKKDTLWVKWVHSVKLRGRSIWEVSIDVNDSWGWKNLLNIRDIIRNNVKNIIESGNETSIWFDNWCSLSPLSNFISHRDLYDARLRGDLRVRDMIVNGQWRWPYEWNEKFPMLKNLVVPTIKNGVNDRIVWHDKFGKDVAFSVSVANRDMNDQGPCVPWWKLIWFPQCIPKHSFILWLAVQNRLTTLDKLKNWGDYAVNRCCLCCQDAEDLDHLMFKCEFASEVWNKISVIADMQINSTDMKVLIHHLSEAGNGNNIQSVIRKMAFAAAVYGIWSERNGRIFKEEIRSCDVVVKCITDNMRNKLLGIKVKDSCQVRMTGSLSSVLCKEELKAILNYIRWVSCLAGGHLSDAFAVGSNWWTIVKEM